MAAAPTTILLCCMLLSLSAEIFAASPSGPVVGVMTGTKLSLDDFGYPPKRQLLQLALDAAVSSFKCGTFGGSLSLRVSINTTDGSNPTGRVTIAGVPFKCNGVPVAALGTGPDALPAQLSPPNKKIVTYCLSSSASPSPIFFGAEDINFMPNKRPISPLLQYTPFAAPPLAKHSYSIHVEAVKVNDRLLPGVNSTTFAISTGVTYTRLASPIYEEIRGVFRRMTIQRVPPVAPFDTCFNASGFSSTRVGPGVPPVELQLAGNTTWTLFGFNTIALVKDGTVGCLAFVRAGPPPAVSVVGTFQQMENLIRFDLEKQRFGFTGVLSFAQTTCANFNTTSAST